MTWEVGDTMTQAEINGIISVFCHYYEHHETFEYTDETIEFDNCDLTILNGIYSDEELIVETPLKVQVSNERFPSQNYYLACDYYSYAPDMDDELPILKRDYYPLTLDENNTAEIDFNDADVVYIMLNNWELVTKFDKTVIKER